MLKKIILFVSVVIFATSCTKPCVIGVGQPTLDSRKIEAFNTITIEGPFNVSIVSDKNRANGGKASVEAQANLLPFIITEVKDSNLVIRLDGCVTTDRNLKVALATGRLDKIENTGSGDVSNEKGISTDNLKLENSGSGVMNLRIKSRACSILNSGSGAVTLQGFIEEMVMELSGSGDIYAPNLRINDAKVTNSGSGNIETWVEGTCEAFLSGSGNITLNGKQESYSEKVSGSGTITKSTLIIK